jgi:hypothetical protein
MPSVAVGATEAAEGDFMVVEEGSTGAQEVGSVAGEAPLPVLELEYAVAATLVADIMADAGATTAATEATGDGVDMVTDGDGVDGVGDLALAWA